MDDQLIIYIVSNSEKYFLIVGNFFEKYKNT